jgi:3-phenylpropionate/trans-cinnamate dioxygenase ferredoxin reductase component
LSTDLGQHIVIVGGGHGGGSTAAFLRQYGWKGPITLISDETVPPYHRPPLSKAWLKGEADAQSLALRPAKFYLDQNVTLRLATRVAAIDRPGRRVLLGQGEAVAYDRLILALGSRARLLDLPGAELDGILTLRSAVDAERLKAALGPGRRLAIIGGGYIGLEVAASARALGSEVVILEREARVLARVACPTLARFFHSYHQRQGVAFRLDVSVAGFAGSAGKVQGVSLADGEIIPCDVVLIGVGGVANDAPGRAAGLDCADGIVVDQAARTSDPSIYAVGDCTDRPLPLYHRHGRLESVPNALEQAKLAAGDLCGRAPPAPEVPWFWSDQYDLKLQIAGLPFDATEIVERGDPASAAFALFHLNADNQVQAVEACNAAAEFMAGKSLIAKRTIIDRARLKDASISMKDIAA